MYDNLRKLVKSAVNADNSTWHVFKNPIGLAPIKPTPISRFQINELRAIPQTEQREAIIGNTYGSNIRLQDELMHGIPQRYEVGDAVKLWKAKPLENFYNGVPVKPVAAPTHLSDSQKTLWSHRQALLNQNPVLGREFETYIRQQVRNGEEPLQALEAWKLRYQGTRPSQMQEYQQIYNNLQRLAKKYPDAGYSADTFHKQMQAAAAQARQEGTSLVAARNQAIAPWLSLKHYELSN